MWLRDSTLKQPCSGAIAVESVQKRVGNEHTVATEQGVELGMSAAKLNIRSRKMTSKARIFSLLEPRCRSARAQMCATHNSLKTTSLTHPSQKTPTPQLTITTPISYLFSMWKHMPTQTSAGQAPSQASTHTCPPKHYSSSISSRAPSFKSLTMAKDRTTTRERYSITPRSWIGCRMRQ
jgi:hypothetical protein